jgi:hypothetical protein
MRGVQTGEFVVRRAAALVGRPGGRTHAVFASKSTGLLVLVSRGWLCRLGWVVGTPVGRSKATFWVTWGDMG